TGFSMPFAYSAMIYKTTAFHFPSISFCMDRWVRFETYRNGTQVKYDYKSPEQVRNHPTVEQQFSSLTREFTDGGRSRFLTRLTLINSRSLKANLREDSHYKYSFSMSFNW